MKISYNQARNNLKDIINQVNESKEAVLLTTEDEDTNAILVSEDKYNAMVETIYLLQSPANAKRLQESIDQLEGHEP